MQNLRIIALLLAFSLAACNKTETPPAPSASTPGGAAASPATPANAAVSAHTFRLADGSDLAGIKNQNMLHPQFELTPDEVDSPLIFGVVQNDEKHSSSPVLVKKFGPFWKVIEVSEAREQEWVYAAACPARKEVWGILDASGEPRASQLTLLRSIDGGNSWQYFSAVKKMTPAAEYAGFSIARSGEGRLSMHVEEDDGDVSHGYYHYKTIDGGKSWTGPTLESDDVVEADTLKSFDTIQDAIKAGDAAPAEGNLKQ